MSEGRRDSLRAALAAHGGAVAGALVEPAAPDGAAANPSAGDLTADGPAATAAAGPRTRQAREEYGLLLDMILEGSRLHYGGPRVVAADPDLGLLLGDQLYALGLQRLSAIGDIAAVRELADTISLVAQAHAEGASERAEAAWESGAVAIGWGPSEAHEAAKARARQGDPTAVDALRGAARDGREQGLPQDTFKRRPRGAAEELCEIPFRQGPSETP